MWDTPRYMRQGGGQACAFQIVIGKRFRLLNACNAYNIRDVMEALFILKDAKRTFRLVQIENEGNDPLALLIYSLTT